MTREEAKKKLSKMIFELGFEDNVDDKVYALNMAIQALSQEPTFDDECQIDMDEAWEQIQKKRKRIPVTQKSGKWIDYQNGRWIYAKCSECGTVHDTRTNYCPNCGCRMVEPQERSEKK